MKSFDFYDTLFTRLVAEPAGIFRIMEEVLQIPGFAMRRQEAERAARRAKGGAEIDLAAIYRQLPLPATDLARVQSFELLLERQLLVPIRRNLNRVSIGDLVVSDMYLPPGAFESILANHLPEGVRPLLYVSSAVGHRKSDGSLWRVLRAKHPQIELHVGDSERGDVRQVRRQGLRAEHFRGAELNRYERRFVARQGLDGQLIAGVSRATRLSAPDTRDDAAELRSIDEVFSSVIAPLLVAFVESVLEDCIGRGIRDICFLARDGQVLFRIAQLIIAQRALPLQPHYVYGSRHALHLPGFSSIAKAETWLLENTPHLSLAEVAARAEIPLAIIREAGARLGLNDVEANIDSARRPLLKKLLEDPSIGDSLRTTSARKWETALAYYRQVGLLPGRELALVDVGWTGRMQASLRGLLDKAEGPVVTLRGHYLCLSSKLITSEHDSLVGFLNDPDQPTSKCPFDAYRCVVEASLMADHGTTLGFQSTAEGVQPVLGPPPSSQLLEAVERQQATVLRYVMLMLQVEKVRGVRIRWPKDLVSSNLLTMFRRPLPMEVQAFLGRAFFEGQADNLLKEVVRKVPFGTDWLRRHRMGLWPEGSLVASGGRPLLPLVRAARLLKGT
jgi:hypothetical protein